MQRGVPIGARNKPMAAYRRKPGERHGHHWYTPTVRDTRQFPHIAVDVNYWKSFVHARLAVAMGDPGCLSLFGRKPGEHQLLAEHLTAEYRVRTEARGRVVDEWKLRAGGPDNHWLDCLVGCAMAASIQGTVLFGMEVSERTSRKRMKLSELQRRRP